VRECGCGEEVYVYHNSIFFGAMFGLLAVLYENVKPRVLGDGERGAWISKFRNEFDASGGGGRKKGKGMHRWFVNYLGWDRGALCGSYALHGVFVAKWLILYFLP
jgi:hypothetical protein